ncbi:MAG TPA: glutathione synthase [Gammaproteobacteria bacterium]|nr:glutathione synthase [Gammaproteobacteria bacterium]
MKLGIIMDPIEDIKIYKDSSFAMLLAAQSLGWEIYYMEESDLYLADSKACATMRHLIVEDDARRWYRFHHEVVSELGELDVILMRLDPPVDMEYIYVTHILELAKTSGVYIVNDPAALRDVNEKLYINWFPQFTPPTIVTKSAEQLFEFINEQEDIMLKPPAGMGGLSIFRIRKGDTNTRVIIENLTDYGRKFTMAQRYIPEISEGDKRILLIDGEPVPYALARIPQPGDNRGNLAAGGTGRGAELTDRDMEICKTVGPVLRDMGLVFVGLDIIGNYLTEINVTSPTCIREIDSIFKQNIASDLMQVIKKNCLAARKA